MLLAFLVGIDGAVVQIVPSAVVPPAAEAASATSASEARAKLDDPPDTRGAESRTTTDL